MSPRTRVTQVGAVVLAVLILAACTTSSGRSEDSGLAFTPDLADLHGHTWVADNIIDPHHELVPGSKITMTFTEDSLSAKAGCNTHFGGARIHDTELVAGPLASTQIGCPAALAAQDVWLAGFLTSRPTIERLDENLWLSRDDTVVHLTHS